MKSVFSAPSSSSASASALRTAICHCLWDFSFNGAFFTPSVQCLSTPNPQPQSIFPSPPIHFAFLRYSSHNKPGFPNKSNRFYSAINDTSQYIHKICKPVSQAHTHILLKMKKESKIDFISSEDHYRVTAYP